MNCFCQILLHVTAVQAPKKNSTALKRCRSTKKPSPVESVVVGQVVLCKLRGFCGPPKLNQSITKKSEFNSLATTQLQK